MARDKGQRVAALPPRPSQLGVWFFFSCSDLMILDRGNENISKCSYYLSSWVTAELLLKFLRNVDFYDRAGEHVLIALIQHSRKPESTG